MVELPWAARRRGGGLKGTCERAHAVRGDALAALQGERVQRRQREERRHAGGREAEAARQVERTQRRAPEGKGVADHNNGFMDEPRGHAARNHELRPTRLGIEFHSLLKN